MDSVLVRHNCFVRINASHACPGQPQLSATGSNGSLDWGKTVDGLRKDTSAALGATRT